MVKTKNIKLKYQEIYGRTKEELEEIILEEFNRFKKNETLKEIENVHTLPNKLLKGVKEEDGYKPYLIKGLKCQPEYINKGYRYVELYYKNDQEFEINTIA